MWWHLHPSVNEVSMRVLPFAIEGALFNRSDHARERPPGFLAASRVLPQ